MERKFEWIRRGWSDEAESGGSELESDGYETEPAVEAEEGCSRRRLLGESGSN
jgi:hypothetical protein